MEKGALLTLLHIPIATQVELDIYRQQLESLGQRAQSKVVEVF